MAPTTLMMNIEVYILYIFFEVIECQFIAAWLYSGIVVKLVYFHNGAAQGCSRTSCTAFRWLRQVMSREKFPHQNGGGLFTLDGENSLFVIITSHFNNLMQSFLLTKSLCRNIWKYVRRLLRDGRLSMFPYVIADRKRRPLLYLGN